MEQKGLSMKTPINKLYTGVGSRNTPANIKQIMYEIAHTLASYGYTLRSGGAAGADTAFESGANLKEIYLAGDCTPAAMNISKKYHPAWHLCSEYARRLHGRNAFQVLGKDLNTPSAFLICWTEDGASTHKARTRATGGTGTAISIADAYQIRITNLGNPAHLAKARAWLKRF